MRRQSGSRWHNAQHESGSYEWLRGRQLRRRSAILICDTKTASVVLSHSLGSSSAVTATKDCLPPIKTSRIAIPHATRDSTTTDRDADTHVQRSVMVKEPWQTAARRFWHSGALILALVLCPFCLRFLFLSSSQWKDIGVMTNQISFPLARAFQQESQNSMLSVHTVSTMRRTKS